MKPVPMSRDGLAATLHDIADLVAAGDSWEGSIQYLMPTEEVVPIGTYALVTASYRIGNTMGQGGVRLIGEMETSTTDDSPQAVVSNWHEMDR